MAGAQFNARPQLTAAVNGLAVMTEGKPRPAAAPSIRVTEEDERGRMGGWIDGWIDRWMDGAVPA